MFKKLLKTDNDTAALILRVLLGIVFIPHGLQKLAGFSGVYSMFTTQLGIPALFAYLAILTEIVGPVALIIGFLTRLAALAIGVEMVVAALLLHVKNGFFMNWFGNQKGEGFEYHILVVAIALALVIKGAGALSVDRAIAKK